MITVNCPVLILILTVSLQFTVQELGLPSLLSFTSPLVPASNGGHSFSWVPTLSLHHRHSNLTHSTPTNSIYPITTADLELSNKYWNTAKSKLSYNRRSVGQSVLVSGQHPGHPTSFSFPFTEIIFRYLQFFGMGCPL
jgi:hypothetical protein